MTRQSTHQNQREMDFDFRFRYETLRSLLEKNVNSLQILGDLEADLNHLRHYDKQIKRPIQRLINETLLMSQELNKLAHNKYADLYDIIVTLRNKTNQLFQEEKTDGTTRSMVFKFGDSEVAYPELIGGKAYGIWLLTNNLPEHVPPGFVVTTAAYNSFLDYNNLHQRIRLLLNNLDVTEDRDLFCSRTATIRKLIRQAAVPDELSDLIEENVAIIERDKKDCLWAVRSSAVHEDSSLSFAGQFDSELNIEKEKLGQAYKNVLASRFNDGAVLYRIHHNFREVESSMAVIFMPMVSAVAAGVIDTTDIKQRDNDTLLVHSVRGLANRLMKGKEEGDTVFLTKWPIPRIEKCETAAGGDEKDSPLEYIGEENILALARMALKATETFNAELNIEWALDGTGRTYFLQARQMSTSFPKEHAVIKRIRNKDTLPVVEGGVTIFPGRAEGPVCLVGNLGATTEIPKGSIIVVDNPQPELASILPHIAGLIAIRGNPVGHFATLIREFSIPCIFKMGLEAKRLVGRKTVSINATKRVVYPGARWVGMKEKVLARIAAGNKHKQSGPLYELILGLNLLDPDAPSFKARACQSIHDTIRFMHEMAVRSLFGFGDAQDRGWTRKSKKLQTPLPLKFRILGLDDAVPHGKKQVTPEEIGSLPFHALWSGISDPRLPWTERWKKQMMGMPADFQETVLGGHSGPRKSTDDNYAIVAKDYLNLNARFAYHYAMIDAMVGPGSAHNHVNFRFRGGGASDVNKIRRARFLEIILRHTGFAVTRQGDMVNAWFRRYPQEDSESVLTSLGRLIVCAKELDVVLRSDNSVKLYAEHFINDSFSIFQ